MNIARKLAPPAIALAAVLAQADRAEATPACTTTTTVATTQPCHHEPTTTPSTAAVRVTTTVPTTADVPTTMPATTTTAPAPTPPEGPVPSTPDIDTATETAVGGDPTPLTAELPRTGADSRPALWAGGLLVALGTLSQGAGRSRKLNKENAK